MTDELRKRGMAEAERQRSVALPPNPDNTAQEIAGDFGARAADPEALGICHKTDKLDCPTF
jgi:hypothetical protein